MAQRLERAVVIAYLQAQQTARPEHQTWFAAFEDLYTKKLWHQLTLKLFDYISHAPGNKDLLALHQNFIAEFEMRINPLALVEFMSKLVYQIQSNPDQCIELIESVKPKVKQSKMASILCSIICGELKQIKGDVAGVEKLLEELTDEIDDVDGVTPVHARYYLLASDHYKLIGNHCKYYRNALRYLGCLSDKEEIPQTLQQQQERAFTLSLAALLGEDIYNFGELLQHPIMNSLDESKKWIVNLLEAFNTGDLSSYERLRPQWITQPDLATHELNLRKKISLLCLMEMTFRSLDGVLTFDQIAQQSRARLDEVEMLVMRALSLGLVRGTIDQVEGIVHLTWVKPRVLNKQQIISLKGRLEELCKDARVMEGLLESKAQEIMS